MEVTNDSIHPYVKQVERHGIFISERKAEVVDALLEGFTNKEIGKKLYVTEKTVKFHLTEIYKIYGVKSRAQLIVYAHNYAKRD